MGEEAPPAQLRLEAALRVGEAAAAAHSWGRTEFMGTKPTTTSTTGLSIPVTTTALGDAFSQALGSQSIAAFDSLGFSFWYDAGSFTVAAPAGATTAARLQEMQHPVLQQHPVPETWQMRFKKGAAAQPGHLALANGTARLDLGGPEGVSASLFHAPERLQGLTFSWRPEALPMVSLGAGYLKEQESLLGSRASGAFGQLSGETLFLNGSPSQPLRVEQGSATFSLPTHEGLVSGTTLSSPLTPSGRQLDLAAALELPLGIGRLTIGGVRSTQPRHQQQADLEWTFFTGHQARW